MQLTWTYYQQLSQISQYTHDSRTEDGGIQKLIVLLVSLHLT